MNEPKRPAAVVWMERPDGRVLALTRGDDFADWHLPGGKWEEVDGYEICPRYPNLRVTACREFSEETGVHLDPESLVAVTSYVTRSGRPVLAFVAPLPTWVPDRFPRNTEGQQPAWMPPSMLALPSCSFGVEFLGLQRAVMVERVRVGATGWNVGYCDHCGAASRRPPAPNEHVKPADAHDDPR